MGQIWNNHVIKSILCTIILKPLRVDQIFQYEFVANEVFLSKTIFIYIVFWICGVHNCFSKGKTPFGFTFLKDWTVISIKNRLYELNRFVVCQTEFALFDKIERKTVQYVFFFFLSGFAALMCTTVFQDQKSRSESL